MPNGDRINYVIDGQNRRIGKKLNGQIVKRWIYSGQLSPVAELDSAGNVIARFAGGYMIMDGNTYQLVTDHLGSIRLVVDITTGMVTQKIDYDEFGNVVYDSNHDFQPFNYACGLYDSQTNLIRFGARDYDAKIGRWICKDQIRFWSRQTNFYSYVNQQPISYIDPTGLSTACYYCQRSGTFRCFDITCPTKPNRTVAGTGWAGRDADGYEGKNNPALEYKTDIGPIPAGHWNIGPAEDRTGRTGPVSFPVTPVDFIPYYRTDFYIHGPSTDSKKYGNESKGCIILDRATRDALDEAIKNSGGNTDLYVLGDC